MLNSAPGFSSKSVRVIESKCLYEVGSRWSRGTETTSISISCSSSDNDGPCDPQSKISDELFLQRSELLVSQGTVPVQLGEALQLSNCAGTSLGCRNPAERRRELDS